MKNTLKKALVVVACLLSSFYIISVLLSSQFNQHFDKMVATFNQNEIYIYNVKSPDFLDNFTPFENSLDSIKAATNESDIQNVLHFPGKDANGVESTYFSYVDDARLKNQCIYYDESCQDGIFIYQTIDMNVEELKNKKTIELTLQVPTSHTLDLTTATHESGENKQHVTFDGIVYEYQSYKVELPIKGILDNKIWPGLITLGGYIPQSTMESIFKEVSPDYYANDYQPNLLVVNATNNSLDQINQALQELNPNLTAIELSKVVQNNAKIYTDTDAKYTPLKYGVLALIALIIAFVLLQKDTTQSNCTVKNLVVNAVIVVVLNVLLTTVLVTLFRNSKLLYEVENNVGLYFKMVIYPIIIYAVAHLKDLKTLFGQ